MATALTLFPTSTADTLVTTANTLVTAAPNAETSKTSKTGKLTAWGVLWSQGNTGTWAAGVSEAAFGDVHGFIFNNTLLEGNTLLAGAYTVKAKLSTSSGTVTGVLHCLIGKRSSAGVFTSIVDIAFPSTGYTSVAAVVTGTGTSVADTVFNTGDKLYVDYYLNITANTSASTTATTSLFENLSTNESIVTPGYIFTAPAGSYSLTGQAATLDDALNTSPASAILAGQSPILNDSLNTSPSSFTLSGKYPLLSTFNDTTYWTLGNPGGTNDPNSVVSTTSSQLQVTTDPATAGSGSAGVISTDSFTFQNSQAIVKIAGVNTGNVNTDTKLSVYVDNANSLRLYVENNQLFGSYKLAGVETFTSVAYNATTQAFIRISEASGTIFWSYSSDGITWTVFNSVSTSTFTPGLSSVKFALYSSTFGAGTAETDTYTNFSTTAPRTFISTDATLNDALNTSPGSFNLTGQDATLTASSSGSVTLTAPAGSYSLTGQAATLDDALSASPGSLSLTSSSANLNSAVTTSPGSFNLTGQTANLNRALTTSPGSFTLTSSSVGLNSSLINTVTSFSLTGQITSLNDTLTTSPVSFALTGKAAILNDALNDIPPGSYNLTGQDATLTLTGGITLTAPVGTYNLTGEPASLNTSLATSQGTFNLTGQASNVNNTLSTSPGSFNLTGSASLVNTTLSISTGSFNLTGQTPNLNSALNTTATSFNLTGQPLTLTSSLTTSPGSFNLTGKASTLNDTLTASATSFNLTGNDATFNITGPITFITSVTSFIIIGQDGTLSLTQAPLTSSSAITNTSNNLFRGAPTPFTVPIPIEEFFRPKHQDFKNYDEDENKRKRGIEEEALLLTAYRKIELHQRILKEDEEYLLKI